MVSYGLHDTFASNGWQDCLNDAGGSGRRAAASPVPHANLQKQSMQGKVASSGRFRIFARQISPKRIQYE
jgi:hypothetical protein